MSAFVPSRPDGRSDRRIIYELAEDASPDSLFDHATLIEALEEGVDAAIPRERVYRAVRQGNKLLLRERRRYLASVPGLGYRVIRSDEHLPVALGKKSRAESQIKQGIDLLRNVRLDELSEPQRTVHVGQLMILDGVYRMAKAAERRQAQHDEVLIEMRRQQQEIMERLDKIDAAAP